MRTNSVTITSEIWRKSLKKASLSVFLKMDQTLISLLISLFNQ